MRIKIFLFHRVHPKRDALWDPIDPAHFDWLISSLKKKYTLVTLEDAVLEGIASSAEKRNRNDARAAVVFDDGYKDFQDYALPVLKKYNCPASMYVVTNSVETGLPPWTYILDEQLFHTKKMKLDLRGSEVAGYEKEFVFASTEERVAFARKLKLHLKSIPNSKRVAVCKLINEQFNDVELPKNLMMNWNELKQISAEGIEIGSHSVTHPLLAKMETEEEILFELKQSKEIIQHQLGFAPKTISYPIGSFDERVMKIAKQLDYKMGLAVQHKTFDSEKQNQFAIPRVELYNESKLKTSLRMNGVLQKVKSLLGK